jgi:hypothetical protein
MHCIAARTIVQSPNILLAVEILDNLYFLLGLLLKAQEN